jgi:hypothetical protein
MPFVATLCAFLYHSIVRRSSGGCTVPDSSAHSHRHPCKCQGANCFWNSTPSEAFMSQRITLLFLLPLLWSLPQTPLFAQFSKDGSQAYDEAIRNYRSPALTARLELLRSSQRRGYATVLSEGIRRDGLFGLVALLKAKLQIEFSLSHTPILTDVTAPEVFERYKAAQNDTTTGGRRDFERRALLAGPPPARMYMYLNIDWSFPADPWKRAQ